MLALVGLYVVYEFNTKTGDNVFANRIIFLLLTIIMLSLASYLFKHWGRWFLVPSVLTVMMSLTVGLESFSVPFSPKAIGKLERKILYIPSDFKDRHELYKVMLPRVITKSHAQS